MGKVNWEEDEVGDSYEYQRRYQAARTEIARFLDEVTVTTVGALGRRYPEWQDLILTIIKDLKLEGRVAYDEYRPAPSPVQACRVVEREKFISRKMVQGNPHKAFLFGDNLARRGYGGQAKEMRDEPNAIGIPTKYWPTMDESAFFRDEDFELNKAHIDEAFKKVIAFKTVVIPADGIGTGLAQMASRAPRTYAYLQEKLQKLWKIEKA